MNLQQIKNAITKKITDIDKAKQGLYDVMPLTWKAGELNDAKWKIFSPLTFFKDHRIAGEHSGNNDGRTFLV